MEESTSSVTDKKRKREITVSTEEEQSPTSSNTNESSATSEAKVEASAAVVSSGFDGFSAYAKSNPFADAIASNGSKNAFTLFGKVNSTMPPPISMPSPKSPKVNPFSSPSPVHNPFMTIVESKDDLWKTMANDKLSAEETARKSFFGSSSSKGVKSVFQQQSESQNSTGTSVDGGGSDDEDTAGADGEDNDDSKALDNQAFVKYAMPENVVVVTGEEQDNCLLQVRAKLFRLHVAKPAGNGIPVDAPSSSSSTSATAAGTAASEAATSAEDPTSPAAANAPKPKAQIPKIQPSGVFLFDHAEKKKEEDAPAESKAEWIEVGIGPVRLLQSGNTGADGQFKSNGRLVMRREEKKGGIGTKLLLNTRINQFTKVTKQTDKVVSLFCLNHAEIGNGSDTDDISKKFHTYLLKTKTNQESDDVLAIINDFIAHSSKETESQ